MLDFEDYNKRMYDQETEFEKLLPRRFVNLVGKSFLTNTHNVGLDKIVKICKTYKLTYSQYQQMESLFLAKLNRKIYMASTKTT